MKRILFVMLILSQQPLLAQDSIESNPPLPSSSAAAPVEVMNAPPRSSDAGAPDVISVMTTNELWLSFGVLIFGFLVMLVELYLMKINQFDQNQAVKFILVTLVITSALFLIAAGFSNNQIASAMGLLGTIAGYLLGRSQSSESSERKPTKD